VSANPSATGSQHAPALGHSTLSRPCERVECRCRFSSCQHNSVISTGGGAFCRRSGETCISLLPFQLRLRLPPPLQSLLPKPTKRIGHFDRKRRFCRCSGETRFSTSRLSQPKPRSCSCCCSCLCFSFSFSFSPLPLPLLLLLLLFLLLGRAGLQPRVKACRVASSTLPKAGAKAQPQRLYIAVAFAVEFAFAVVFASAFVVAVARSPPNQKHRHPERPSPQPKARKNPLRIIAR
jgi:hypothetical protein